MSCLIDWHSHILPEMDDGSRSLSESLAMLGALREQGVMHVVATPHFYADNESVERFLERRAESFRLLEGALTPDLPQVLLGAEVRYYPGIRRLEQLERLTIGSTGLLLLEMPLERWSEYQLNELRKLSACAGTFRVVLAHIDRYLPFLRRGVVESLCDECGILLQSNAGVLDRFGERMRVLRLIRSGRVQFIGSDCHNMTERPPRMTQAFDRMEKALGHDAYSAFLNIGAAYLSE